MSAQVWFMVQLWFWWPFHFVLWECNLHAMQIISQKSACQVESGRKGIRNCSWCKLPSAPSWELGDPKTNLLTGACSMAPAHIGQGSRVTCIQCCILNEEFHNSIWLEDILKAVQNGCPSFIQMLWKLCKKQLSKLSPRWSESCSGQTLSYLQSCHIFVINQIFHNLQLAIRSMCRRPHIAEKGERIIVGERLSDVCWSFWCTWWSSNWGIHWTLDTQEQHPTGTSPAFEPSSASCNHLSQKPLTFNLRILPSLKEIPFLFARPSFQA